LLDAGKRIGSFWHQPAQIGETSVDLCARAAHPFERLSIADRGCLDPLDFYGGHPRTDVRKLP
jgi:hypothetical protein